MKVEYSTLAGKVITLMAGDVVLVRYHGEHGKGFKNWFRERSHRAITWIPGFKGRHAGYGHAAGLGASADTTRVISAEARGVVPVPLKQWETHFYSLIIIRPKTGFAIEGMTTYGFGEIYDEAYDRAREAAEMALRKRLGFEKDKQLGTGYSKLGVAAQALDVIFSLGRILWKKRPISFLVAKVDPANYCSETEALAFDRAWQLRFYRFGTFDPISPNIVQPKDIEWTAAVLGWEVIYKTSHGTPTYALFYSEWIRAKIKKLDTKHAKSGRT